tara:strand:- start:649 stop:1626 length:978 start_codon:yes stop_codon:yes gene_type:complete
MKEEFSRKFCVAPMMGYTTPYARNLYRSLSKKSFLFTEMIATKTMLNSKNRDLIIENNKSNPVALQVGGSDLRELQKCSKIAYEYNYDEINLNVGCPSKSVQQGYFGACLMKDKQLVRSCIESMQSDKIIVSMKCRIGLGKELNYDFFEEFIEYVSRSGIKLIYVHARNAILKGISPKANRSVPKLDYNFVKKIKSAFPEISFILNGGINSIEEAKSLSNEFDGLMLGRLIQNNPFVLRFVDQEFYNLKENDISTEKIIVEYFEYIKPKVKFESIFRLLSPLLQIFFGVPNSKTLKLEVHNNLKSCNINKIERLFLDFVKNYNYI